MTPHARARLAVPLALAALSMLGPFAIDTPFPAFTEMGADFDVSAERMQLVVTAYLVPFGLMSPFHGPLSDALGRRPVMLGGVALYAIASVGIAMAPTFAVLLVFRVIQGLVAGGGVIVSRTVIRDVYDGAEAQRLMSRVMMIFGLAPAVAPVIGGLLLQVGQWPGIFWFQAGIAAALIAVVVLILPETHPPDRRTPLRVGALLGSLATVVRSARFHRVAWAGGLAFGGQFLFIGQAPTIVVDQWGRGELDFWMLFVPMIAGVMAGSFISGRAAGRIGGRQLVTAGSVFAFTGSLVGLAIAASPVAAVLPYAAVGVTLIAGGTAAAYPTVQLILLDQFPHARGAAVSMFTFFTLLLNGVAATAAAPLARHSLLALSALATILIGLGLLSWLWHLRVDKTAPTGTRYPEPLEPTDRI